LNIFETFNFDIIIILVLFSAVASGFYYSLYRQAKKTLILIIPFIFLYFTLDKIMLLLMGLKPFSKAVEWLIKFFKINSYKNVITTFIVSLIVYIIIAYLVKFVYDLFKPSVQKRVLTQPSLYTRSLASLLGLVNGYIIVMVLMFAIKPFINVTYDKPLTSIINQTNNEVITISELNEIVNINTDSYVEYDENFKLLSGRVVLNELNSVNTFLSEIPNLNEEIKNNMLPSLSQESLDLINLNVVDENYIGALMKKDKKLIFDTILVNEKQNDNYLSIKNTYDYLMKNQGYLYLYDLNNDISNLNFFDLYQIIYDNKEEIKNHYDDFSSQIKFQNTIVQFTFFFTHFEDFKALVPEANIDDLQTYVLTLEESFESHILIEQYSNRFKELYASNKDPIIKNLNKAFKEYIKYSDNVVLINKEMSFASKITLSRNYSNWYHKDISDKHILLKSYLIDSLCDENINGNKLYQEYFFYNYLGYDINFEDKIDIEDFNIILSRLESLITTGLITNKQAEKYMNIIINKENNVFFDLEQRNKLSDSLYSDLENLENTFIEIDVVN